MTTDLDTGPTRLALDRRPGSELAAAALPSNAHGHFAAGGREFVVTDPRPPRPWVNVISNPRVGLVVSQTGSGLSWIDNSQMAVSVRWRQDLADDASGRFLYLWDRDSGEVWSLAPAPCRPAYDRFACRHGLGYTRFETAHRGVAAEWALGVDREETVEVWKVRLAAETDGAGGTAGDSGDTADSRRRRLSLVAFLEWNCGVSPAPRREFQKLFLETGWDPDRRTITAGSHMWDAPSERWGHWNRDYPYWSAFAAAQAVTDAEGDKAAFLGAGDWARPGALADPDAPWPQLFGRHHDPVGVLRCDLEIAPGEPFEGGFVLATTEDRDSAADLAARFADPARIDAALEGATEGWRRRLAGHRLATPDPVADVLLNDWLRYQAISSRLWGRAGYYQQSGAYGYRDQLQDSQVWLTVDPRRCREQLSLHAAHQFVDGSVYHWWHPLTEVGHVTRMTDDLHWLAFVAAAYVKETGDMSVLDDPAPWLDEEGTAPLSEHVSRAFHRLFRRTGPRGLPYVGGGDWNDGLSALGLEERGESVWLGHFVVGLLADWAEIHRRRGDDALAAGFTARRDALVEAINEHAWDGAWYRRATRDDGTWIGTAGAREGRIFLNAQTWAVLNDVAPEERARAAMDAVEEHLVSERAGALLLAPAFDTPDETVGYITRYAPGLRENGGVYTHAAVWAVAAAAKLRRAGLAGRLLDSMLPARKDPATYWAEPYVLPGNVDGPDSPHHGRAGWTWYTGSAAWLPRVVHEWIVGVRPTWRGLELAPCLPPAWDRVTVTRPWRGATLEIEVQRDAGLADGEVRVQVDGTTRERPVIAGAGEEGGVEPGATHRVMVRCG